MPETAEAGTITWPDLAIGLYDKLTGRGAEIMYDFDNLEVSIPSCACPDPEYAKWKVNGTLRIHTKDNAHAGSH